MRCDEQKEDVTRVLQDQLGIESFVFGFIVSGRSLLAGDVGELHNIGVQAIRARNT